MKASTYRDMHLLDEVTQQPHITQRELSKRIGAALGLTNLMLRRLAKKGYIKISGTKRSRLRYLITPNGILEKSRLTREFVQYSLQLYSRARHFLHAQLSILARTGHRRVLLYGTGELAEIAYLVIQEIGLELAGIVDEVPAGRESFLGYRVQSLEEIPASAYDRLIISSLRDTTSGLQRFFSLGISHERMIVLPMPGMPSLSITPLPDERVETVSSFPTPTPALAATTASEMP